MTTQPEKKGKAKVCQKCFEPLNTWPCSEMHLRRHQEVANALVLRAEYEAVQEIREQQATMYENLVSQHQVLKKDYDSLKAVAEELLSDAEKIMDKAEDEFEIYRWWDKKEWKERLDVYRAKKGPVR